MRRRLSVVLGLAIAIGPALAPAAESEFSRHTIDLGVVVSDVEKAVKFYTEAVGFTEVKGFSVPADFCTNSGLTDGKKLDIRVLVLGEGPDATKLKLMHVPGAKSKSSDNGFIHSQLGFSYLTIFVNILERCTLVHRINYITTLITKRVPWLW